MVKLERTGRPTGNSFVINLIYTKILVYRKKYNLTAWNAWNKLAEHKAFKDLMRKFYKGKKNKNYYIDRMLNNKEARNKFYINNIKRKATGIQSLVITKPSEYTRRKKRK
ncbi:MAG TPA: hypothetical protein DCL80_07400 [Balneola sp.]|nr:hypothetical protein [Balneola sp.]|tara:strand:- start:179 stop:508 length:330 start_codon:yes stop_codon:yes gene_type:complete